MDSVTGQPVQHGELQLEVRWRRAWTVRVIELTWRAALWLTERLIGLAQLQMRAEGGRWQTLPERLHADLGVSLEWRS